MVRYLRVLLVNLEVTRLVDEPVETLGQAAHLDHFVVEALVAVPGQGLVLVHQVTPQLPDTAWRSGHP